jgi:hypothetical protein
MTTNQIWDIITSQPKWYAGIKTRTGSYHTAQSANRLKNRFKKKMLSEEYIEYILNRHGFIKNEITWTKIDI